MISYSTVFDPPAPVLAVQLTGIVHSRPRVTLPALLDTGSDFTAVPANLVSRLKLYAVRPQLLEDFSGKTREEILYGVRLGYAHQPARDAGYGDRFTFCYSGSGLAQPVLYPSEWTRGLVPGEPNAYSCQTMR